MGFVGIFCWLYGSISGQLYSEKYISGHRKKFCDCVSGISMKNGLAKVYLAVFARMSSVLYIIFIKNPKTQENTNKIIWMGYLIS